MLRRAVPLLLIAGTAAGCLSHRTLVRPAELSLQSAEDALAAERRRIAESKPLDRQARFVSPRRAPPKPMGTVLLVLDVEDGNNRLVDGARAQLAGYLALRAVERKQYWLVPSGATQRRLRRQQARALEPCFDDACPIEIGKALAAQAVMAPRILADGERCVLAATLYDLQSETAKWAKLVGAECSRAAMFEAAEVLIEALPAAEQEQDR